MKKIDEKKVATYEKVTIWVVIYGLIADTLNSTYNLISNFSNFIN